MSKESTDQPTPVSNNPSLAKMATSATSAAVKFLASGMKTVDQDTHDTRVAMCSGCEYHDNNRCNVCGCFTDKKAWLPFEDCPIGKWTV